MTQHNTPQPEMWSFVKQVVWEPEGSVSRAGNGERSYLWPKSRRQTQVERGQCKATTDIRPRLSCSGPKKSPC